MADDTKPTDGDERTREEERRRRDFARRMARAAFGRHYWDDRSQEALNAAMRKPPKKNKT